MKSDSLFNVINHQSGIDKIYLYAKDPFELKYEFLIKNQEDVRTKLFNNSKAFIEYFHNTVEIYKDIEDYIIQRKKRKILIIFDDMIAYMLSNKKRNPIVTELFARGRKLNISFVFICFFFLFTE